VNINEKSFLFRFISLFLIFLLACGNLLLYPQEAKMDKLFQWAKMDYNAGKYRDVATDLELILSYYGKEAKAKNQTGGLKLKGKIYLLLGATYEKLGRIPEAKENYKMAKMLLAEQDLQFEDVNFNDLTVYRQIIDNKEEPVQTEINIIERPTVKPRKKKKSLWLFLTGGVLIAGAVVTLLLLNKKNKKEIELDENFDTEEMGIQWVGIPTGEYLMGDNFNEGDADELPVHPIRLNRYSISKFEITFAQYDLYLKESGINETPPSSGIWVRGNFPVINVNWKKAYNFCVWLSKKTGKKIYLPTEAQWEIAARGADQNRFPWGNTPPDCRKTNHNCFSQTEPVGSHPEGTSYFGVQDMAGNVSEWCWDIYEEDFYQRSRFFNPINRPPDERNGWYSFVIRGGSWYAGDSSGIRSADRSFGRYRWGTIMAHGMTANDHLGFRIVKMN